MNPRLNECKESMSLNVEFGMDVLEDIDVVIIGHGIAEGPIVGMKIPDCLHDGHLFEDVMNVAIWFQSVRSWALELNEVAAQLGPHARKCVRIIPVTVDPTHRIE